jgi:hypothetical protein
MSIVEVQVGQIWGSKTRGDLLLRVIKIRPYSEAYHDESIKVEVIQCKNPDLMGHMAYFSATGLTGHYKLAEDILDNPSWEV